MQAGIEALTCPEALHGLVLVRDSIFAEAGHRVVSTVLQRLLLKDDYGILVVTSRHSTSHYSMLLRRLNLNVSKIGAAGRFIVLNTNSLCKLDISADRYLFDISTLMDAVVSDVKRLKGASGEDPRGSPRRRCVVLFDDVVALLNTCRDHPLTLCRAISGLSSAAICRIVVLHEDVDDLDEVTSTLSSEAATVVRLSPLTSGSSTEYEAQCSVVRRKFLTGGNALKVERAQS